MMMLVVGLIIFLGIHVLPTSPDIRDALKGRMGETAYKGLFSLVSLIGLVIIVFGYHKMQLNPGKNPLLWDPPTWTRHIAVLLMLPAMIFLVAAYIPSRIRTALKHPMLVAIKIWALAHLIANGDVASLLLFGSFLGYAVYDRISVKKRGATGPLGVSTVSPAINDVYVVVLGAVFYAALLFGGHAWLFGVSPIPALG